MAEDLAQFRVVLDKRGVPQTVEVNGADVTQNVSGLIVTAPPGQVPTLTLHGRAVGEIEGQGIVQVEVAGAGADVDAIVAFLDAVDPEQLETEALASSTWGDGSLTPKLLEILKGYARGGA